MKNTGDKTELAEERTEWAEDRTLLANERTFAAWIRTGLSGVAVGLGVQAIFGRTEPVWLAKLAACGFIAVGVAVFVVALYSSTKVLKRLSAHTAEPVSGWQLTLIGWSFVAISCGLGVLLWWL